MEGPLLTFSEQLHEVWSKKRLNNRKTSCEMEKSNSKSPDLIGLQPNLIDLFLKCSIFEVLPGY